MPWKEATLIWRSPALALQLAVLSMPVVVAGAMNPPAELQHGLGYESGHRANAARL